MSKYSHTIYGLIFLLFMMGCKDEYTICDANLLVSEKSGFYRRSGGSEQAVSAPVFSLTGLGVPSSIYSNAQNISKFSIPLNPLLDSAKFVLSVNNNSTFDTITFKYNSHSVFISMDCGSSYFHNLSAVSTTRHRLDSISVINNVIDNVSGENVKIYFTP